jgi:hypothetical protein
MFQWKVRLSPLSKISVKVNLLYVCYHDYQKKSAEIFSIITRNYFVMDLPAV